jgi:Ca-activated chloride channel family protein
MAEGFRPANPDVPLGFPFTEDNGITVAGPSNVLNVPAPEVIAAIQESWAFVKKQADIWLVIDVSLSMESDNKLEQAKTAALAFLDSVEDNVGPSNRIGLAVFSDSVQVLVELDNYEVAAPNIRREIEALRPQGGTELYRGVMQIVEEMNKAGDEDRIRAIVLLSDGEDTGEPGVTLNDVTQVISASSGDLNPVIVIPVAYGAGAATDAAARALSTIARASNTRVQSGDPTTILEVLEIISSYF